MREHALLSVESDSHIRDNILNYLQYQPLKMNLRYVAFWRKGLFPGLEKTDMKCLTRSASSVPVQNMFSIMGLLVYGKRSTLAPHRANWLSFTHDNFELYIDIK